MHTHRLGVPFGIAFRVIATAIAAIAITGCNLPSSSTEPTQTPGVYATAQKALQPEGLFNREFKCPEKGIIDYYNLCFRHEFEFKMSEDMKFTVKPYGGVHCMLLGLSSSKISGVGGKTDGAHGSVGFTIDGTWNFPHAKCTLSGTATLNADVYAHGDPPCRNGDQLYLTVFEHWSPAPIHGKCTCTDLCGNPPHTPVPVDITNPMLPDRGVDLVFFPPDDMYNVQRATVGSFTGYFSYEVMSASGVDSEKEPIP
jgi:hypothetical protein